MELNMTEHGLDINVSYNEADDFDNAVVLSLINQLVEELRGVEDVNISISSEFVLNADLDEVISGEYEDEEDSEEEDEEDDSDDSDDPVESEEAAEEESSEEQNK